MSLVWTINSAFAVPSLPLYARASGRPVIKSLVPLPMWGASFWDVEAEVIAPAAVELLVKSGKKESKVPVAATGDDKTFKTVSLGTIDLPAGQTSFEFKGVGQGWKPIQIRKVTLKPAK